MGVGKRKSEGEPALYRAAEDPAGFVSGGGGHLSHLRHGEHFTSGPMPAKVFQPLTTRASSVNQRESNLNHQSGRPVDTEAPMQRIPQRQRDSK